MGRRITRLPNKHLLKGSLSQSLSRKRKEERKVQEKRRKARVKRRTQKERDRHRQRRQKDSAKVETQPGSNSSEDLEKRKIPVTQRQQEALYLMQALLRKIVVRLLPHCSLVWVASDVSESSWPLL